MVSAFQQAQHLSLLCKYPNDFDYRILLLQQKRPCKASDFLLIAYRASGKQVQIFIFNNVWEHLNRIQELPTNWKTAENLVFAE